jgi:hypothetical protein
MLALSNSTEPVPDTFYVFANTNNWLTNHNLQFTKGITSASIGEIMANEELTKKYMNGSIDYLQYIPNAQPDVHGVSLYSMTATRDYRIEYNCELYRRSHEDSRLYHSRMSCIYAFGDLDTCTRVSNMYGWDLNSVKKFKLLSLPLTRVAKVNMEIITLMRNVDGLGTFGPQEQEIIWNYYWFGKGDLALELPKERGSERMKRSSGVLWEYLIEGRLELV